MSRHNRLASHVSALKAGRDHGATQIPLATPFPQTDLDPAAGHDSQRKMAREIELLAPAKNADFGIAAIEHGADAVYIGGPAFGARANAGNSLPDIERLTRYAHRFNARVLIALNTILRDDELENARRLVWQCWDAGADALIVQDMGLLELDLPPIQLHASTQCDIRTPEKARFLESAGFSRLVLARELSLRQIRAIAMQTNAELEFFIHGALCVSYSGQCYLSYAHTGRSANRGNCSQACRLPYSLLDASGTTLVSGTHLLSLRDNDQRANLRALIGAGIRSFKIEGRLKDLAYVKNITACYRQLLDAIIDAGGDTGNAGNTWRRASAGRCTFAFTPRPEKTFNRGATDYFVNARRADIGAFDSPKFVGEPIGQVVRLDRTHFEVDSAVPLHNGDGLSFWASDGKPAELTGLRINLAEPVKDVPDRYRLTPGSGLPAGLSVGTPVYRNLDYEFERLLEKKSAERRLPLMLVFAETPEGFALRLTDERGICAEAGLRLAKEAAQQPERAEQVVREALGKLGNTIYCAASIDITWPTPRFIPAATLNALRRRGIEALDAARQAAYARPARRAAHTPPLPYPEDTLSYLGNVYNTKARAFYEKHGIRLIAPAYECRQEKGEVSLMVTKHCVRYSLQLCPKQVKGLRPDPLALVNGNEKLTLRFDCKPCEMHVVGKLKEHRALRLSPQPATANPSQRPLLPKEKNRHKQRQ